MIKEKIIQTTVYMTSDGKKFNDKNAAEQHEKEILMPEREIESQVISLYTQDYFTICYNIQNEDDFYYLVVKKWKHNYSGDFKGPGWYLTFKYDGGDYDDSYDIIKADEYLTILENDVNIIKNLTNS